MGRNLVPCNSDINRVVVLVVKIVVVMVVMVVVVVVHHHTLGLPFRNNMLIVIGTVSRTD